MEGLNATWDASMRREQPSHPFATPQTHPYAYQTRHH